MPLDGPVDRGLDRLTRGREPLLTRDPLVDDGPGTARLLRALLIALVTSAIVLASLASATAIARKRTPKAVPQGFVGMNIDGPLFWPSTNLSLSGQMDSMVSDGVQSVRPAFDWATAQPYASWSAVPADRHSEFVNGPGGRPISYAASDAIVTDAAERRLTVLPIILYAPVWTRKISPGSTTPIPKDNGLYGQYAASLVRRYGPRGSFWKANPQLPKVPIRQWQIWNEPNILYFWPQPFAKSYVALLRAAHNAIKRADRHAQIVLGPLTNYAWTSLGQIYAVRGAGRLFDAVSVDGYTKNPSEDIVYVRITRHALQHLGGGRKPIIYSEFGWPSAVGHTKLHGDWNTTPNKQAAETARFVALAARNRVALGLSAIYYYDWVNNEYNGAPVFNFSGLQNYDNQGHLHIKPALAAFRRAALAVERCRSKGALATQCRH